MNTGFSVLSARLAPKLTGIACRLAGFADGMDRDDLFQEAMAHLWQSFRAGTLEDKTDSYILQGCYFYLRNHMRVCRDRFSPVSLDAGGEGADDPPLGERLSAEGAHEDYVRSFDARMVADIIRNNGLSAREKQILPYLSEGLTTRQIGGRMGISHVMVVKMKRAIGKKCRVYLDVE